MTINEIIEELQVYAPTYGDISDGDQHMRLEGHGDDEL